MLISKLTLSFFEDSGWYIPIYENANDLVWGKQKGCDFIDSEKCSAVSFSDYFCTAGDANSCNYY